jgi:glycosyltransferase involved in cell wall biosynthesis
MPFFSICIPTHNRVDTLVLAISTVVSQTFADFEIIVSDNATNPSAEKVVAEFRDSRIRYYRHNSLIDVNDNWEFVLQKALGEYVLLLADDDGLVPSALERVAHFISLKKAELILVGHARYAHPKTGGPNGHCANRLMEPAFTGEIYQYDAISLVKDSFKGWGIGSGGGSYERIPQGHPSGLFMARRLLGKVTANNGRITTRSFADVGFLNVTLQANSFHFLDLPLSLIGVDVDREINGPLKGRRRDYDSHNNSINYAPFRATSFNNIAVDAHLQVLNANNDVFTMVDASLTDRFYINHYFEILQDRVRDWRKLKDLLEFLRVVMNLPYNRRIRILAKCMLLPFYRPLRNGFKCILKRKHDTHVNMRWIDGKTDNFLDIVTCSNYIEKKYLDALDASSVIHQG